MTVEEFYIKNQRDYKRALEYVDFYLRLIQEDTDLISRVQSRIKKCDSLKEKCRKKKTAAGDIEKKIRDVAGARCICTYLDWIPKLVEEIKKIPGLAVVDYKDYISEPKANGYSGYHLYCKISTPTNDGNKLVSVEIQIRTQPQDNWASYEHDYRYKANTAEQTEAEKQELDAMFRTLAQKCAEIDALNMQIRDFCEPTKKAL